MRRLLLSVIDQLMQDLIHEVGTGRALDNARHEHDDETAEADDDHREVPLPPRSNTIAPPLAPADDARKLGWGETGAAAARWRGHEKIPAARSRPCVRSRSSLSSRSAAP